MDGVLKREGPPLMHDSHFYFVLVCSHSKFTLHVEVCKNDQNCVCNPAVSVTWKTDFWMTLHQSNLYLLFSLNDSLSDLAIFLLDTLILISQLFFLSGSFTLSASLVLVGEMQ